MMTRRVQEIRQNTVKEYRKFINVPRIEPKNIDQEI